MMAHKLKRKHDISDHIDTCEIVMNQNIPSGELLTTSTLRNITETIKNLPATVHVKQNFEKSSFDDSLRINDVFNIHEAFRVERVKCLNKNSEYIFLPADYAKPVTYTTIDDNIVFSTVADAKMYRKNKQLAWLVVTERFIYNSHFHEVGEVLEIYKPSRFRKCLRFLLRKKRPNELAVISHPGKRKTCLPGHIQGNFKICDSPYTSCYRLLSDLVKNEQFPYLITIPIVDKILANDTKVTSSKHNQKLLVLEKETLIVLLTTDVNNDDYIQIKVLSSSSPMKFETIHELTPTDKIFANDDLEKYKTKIVENLNSIINSKKKVYLKDYFEKKSKKLNTTISEKFKFTFNSSRRHSSPNSAFYSTKASTPQLKSLTRLHSRRQKEIIDSTTARKLSLPSNRQNIPSINITSADNYLLPVTGLNLAPEVNDVIHGNRLKIEASKQNIVRIGKDGYVIVPPKDDSVEEFSSSHLRKSAKLFKKRSNSSTHDPGTTTKNIDFQVGDDVTDLITNNQITLGIQTAHEKTAANPRNEKNEILNTNRSSYLQMSSVLIPDRSIKPVKPAVPSLHTQHGLRPNPGNAVSGRNKPPIAPKPLKYQKQAVSSRNNSVVGLEGINSVRYFR